MGAIMCTGAAGARVTYVSSKTNAANPGPLCKRSLEQGLATNPEQVANYCINPRQTVYNVQLNSVSVLVQAPSVSMLSNVKPLLEVTRSLPQRRAVDEAQHCDVSSQ